MLLKVQEVAELLQVSKWTVYRWIEEGKLQATKIGGNSLRVFQESVDKLINQDQMKARQGKVTGARQDGKVQGRRSLFLKGNSRERTRKRSKTS